MFYVIIAIILIIGCGYAIEKFGEQSARKYIKNNADTVYSAASVNTDIPVPLRGIHPSADSFWDTVDFYVRVGNACYSITHNDYSLAINVYRSGVFNISFFDIDSAKVLLPGLNTDDMKARAEGCDKYAEAFFATLYNVKSTLENDAPEAEIKVFGSDNQKSISIMWKAVYN